MKERGGPTESAHALPLPAASRYGSPPMTHAIARGWRERLAAAVPFGLGQTKPHHFRDMARIA